MGRPRRRQRRRDFGDAGGVWIGTGVVLGLLAYAGVVLMLVAGDTAVLPVVVVPLVLVALIGASNLLGGRSYGRPAGPGRTPLSAGGPNGPVPPPGEDVGEPRDGTGSPGEGP